MFKIILFAALIISTLGAPTTSNDDHPAILNAKTPSTDLNKKETEYQKPDVTKVANERKYGEHVAKRDVSHLKNEPKPENIPLSPEPPKPEHIPLAAAPSASKSKRSNEQPKNLPAENKSSASNVPQLLPATSNDRKFSNGPQVQQKADSNAQNQKPKRQVQSAVSSNDNHSSKSSHESDEERKANDFESKKTNPNEYKPSLTGHRKRRDVHEIPQTGNTDQSKKSQFTLADSAKSLEKSEQQHSAQSQNHQYKRENSPSTVELKAKENDNNEKSNEKSAKNDANAHKNDEKRDIPVALTPSTSAKPEIKQADNNKKDETPQTPKDNKDEKVNNERPLLSYTKPVPVTELFKHHSRST